MAKLFIWDNLIKAVYDLVESTLPPGGAAGQLTKNYLNFVELLSLPASAAVALCINWALKHCMQSATQIFVSVLKFLNSKS